MQGPVPEIFHGSNEKPCILRGTFKFAFTSVFEHLPINV